MIATGREKGTFDSACEHAVKYANRHNGGLELAEQFLERAGWGHATFGTEYISLADRQLAYLNTGDTYSTTIGEENGVLFVTTWGDWLEGAEEEFCEEEGTIRCGYCGEFTPLNTDDWRDCVCEYCQHLVAG